MKAGDVVLCEFVQVNDFKARPALILKIVPPYDDFLVCAISTQLQNQVEGVDEIIEIKDADFTRTGLKATSLVRVTMVQTLMREEIFGKMGEISPRRLERICRNLARFIESE